MDGRFSWSDVSDGGAAPCADVVVLHERSGVFGKVEGIPLPGSYVNGCDGFGEIENGQFLMEVEAPADCDLKVVSVVDGRSALGPSVHVTTAVGSDSEANLTYPVEADYRPIPQADLDRIDAAVRRNAPRELDDPAVEPVP